jgi:hypothetical protein
VSQLPFLYAGIDMSVQGFIRSYCGWHIAPVVEETVTFYGNGTAGWILPTLRLVSVESLTVDGAEWDADWYTVRPSGVIEPRYRFHYRESDVSVTFTHGYGSCPPELEAVAESKIGKLAAGGSRRIGQVQVSVGGDAAGGLDAYTAGVLDRYRLVK